MAAAWMDLGTVTLTEVSQTERCRYYKLPLMRGIQTEKTHELIYKAERLTSRKLHGNQTGYENLYWIKCQSLNIDNSENYIFQKESVIGGAS